MAVRSAATLTQVVILVIFLVGLIPPAQSDQTQLNEFA